MSGRSPEKRIRTGSRHRGRMAAAVLLCLLFVLAGCGSMRPLSLYERGMAALQSGDLDTAMNSFEASVQKEEQKPLGYRGMGLIYLERGDYGQAILSFAAALDSVDRPRLNRAFIEDTSMYLADAYERDGQSDKAMTVYSQLLDSDRAGEAYLLRGKLYAADGKFGQAGQDFQRAVEMDPSYEIYLQIYDVYAGLNRQADGVTFLKQAQTSGSGSAEDLYQMGRISYLLGDFDQSKETLIRASDAGAAGASALLGRVFLEEGDVSGAMGVYQSMVDGRREAAGGYNGLALCAIRNEKYEEALDYVRAGLQTGDMTTAEELLFNEIVAYERMYDFETALTKAESFLETYPGNADGQREYRFLKSRIEEAESTPEDISYDVWDQIMRDWEEEEAAAAEEQAEEGYTEEENEW